MFSFFENLVDPYAPYVHEDTPPNRIWPFIWQYCRPFKRIFVIVVLVSVLIAAIEVGLLYYMGRVVDLLEGSPGQVWAEHSYELVAVAIGLLTLRPLLQTFGAVLLNNTVLPNLGAVVRWRAHAHVLRQSVGWFESDFAGRIANRIMQTPSSLGEVVFQMFDAFSYALAYVVGAGILLSASDPRLLFPLLVWFVFYAALVRWAVKHITPASKAAADARSNLTGRVVDAYTNIHSVKMFAHHQSELAYAKEAIETVRHSFQKEMRIFSGMEMMLTALNGFLVVSVVGWAMMLWYEGSASAGVVAAAIALTLRLNSMTAWIMWAFVTFFRELGVVVEGMQTIAHPVHLIDAPAAKPLHAPKGGVVFEGLSHHYGRESGGIDNLDLTIEPGQKIGLVGPSGAGKSTLLKLLLRFYDPDAGKILIDGQDISKVTQDSLRKHIGMVQQDSALLHRSVRENLLYGNPQASRDEMIMAAKRAKADEFILDLVDPQGRRGYEAHVGERGVQLSGGQRQRITLARAILKDAPVLLLDEATSALDSAVEAEIQQTLVELMQGKTVLAIAHRLSTIAQMDRILVLSGGRIIEDGDHASLLSEKGMYFDLWSRQSGGFIESGK